MECRCRINEKVGIFNFFENVRLAKIETSLMTIVMMRRQL